jgi:hypothetical protein
MKMIVIVVAAMVSKAVLADMKKCLRRLLRSYRRRYSLIVKKMHLFL